MTNCSKGRQEQKQNTPSGCKYPRVALYTKHGLATSKIVPCGNWRKCPSCAMRRANFLKRRALTEVQAVRQALHHRNATTLLITYTLDRCKSTRYGNEARAALATGRDRANREIKRILIRAGCTIISHIHCFETHKDGAIHGHSLFILAGSSPIHKGIFARIGIDNVPTGRLYGYRLYGLGAMFVNVRYHSCESIAAAIYYATKYVTKATIQDWRFLRLKLIAYSDEDEPDCYKGTRWIEFARSRSMRMRRLICKWRSPYRPGGTRVTIPYDTIISGNSIYAITASGQLNNITGVIPAHIFASNDDTAQPLHPESYFSAEEMLNYILSAQVYTLERSNYRANQIVSKT